MQQSRRVGKAGPLVAFAECSSAGPFSDATARPCASCPRAHDTTHYTGLMTRAKGEILHYAARPSGPLKREAGAIQERAISSSSAMTSASVLSGRWKTGVR